MALAIRLGGAFVALAIVLFGFWAWPLYGFISHSGDAPILPLGWHDIPASEAAPKDQALFDDHFRGAGDAVLSAMEAHREAMGVPGMSAAVAVDGEIVWQGVVGWSDLAEDTPVSADTIFRVGSTSKAITGVALARLVDQGIIDLDTPIAQYWDDLPNPAWAAMTPRMLASHTAGLPHYGDNTDRKGWYHSGALKKHYGNVVESVELFDDSTLLYEPGTGFEYSSYGTVLLGAVMAEASGLSYRELVSQEVFEPAAMTSTLVAPKRHGEPEALARFYLIDPEASRARPWRPVDLSHRLPGGGWASTPSDLVQMGSLFLDDDYISPQTRADVWTPVPLANGEVNEQDYAVGWRWREWEVDDVGMMANANHGGVSRGAQSWLLVYPEFDMAIAFTINAKTESFRSFGSFHDKIAGPFGAAVLAQRVAD